MIDARYHITVHFEYPGRPAEMGYTERSMLDYKVTSALLSLERSLSDLHDMNVFEGNAACNPYLTCWSSLMEEAEHAEREILKLLREQGCTVQEGV